MIFKDGRYLTICKKIAKRKHLVEDLHAEFIKVVLETKDDRLIKAQEGGYLEVFLVGIINNIWGKKNRVKTNVNGQTSPLMEFSNYNNYDFFIDSINHDTEPLAESKPLSSIRQSKELNVHRAVSDFHNLNGYDVDSVVNLLESEMDSSDPKQWFRARALYYSYFKFKNPFEFSKESGINYKFVVKACNEMKQFIKTKYECTNC